MNNNFSEKKRNQSKEQILYNIVQILETFPQYNISQHLIHILRRKGDPIEPYFWTDEELLKKLEHYYDELTSELIANKKELKEEDF